MLESGCPVLESPFNLLTGPIFLGWRVPLSAGLHSAPGRGEGSVRAEGSRTLVATDCP